jgi:hypothetical protein
VTPMKSELLRWLTGFVSAVALGGCLCASASAQSQTNKLRIGVYDSRAVAIAYANSDLFKESMKPVEAEYEKAKKDKNVKRVKEIEARMKLQQRRLHEQGFSTGSVAYILAKVKDSLPELARQANVQIIVSKWELNHRSADVEAVDVTDELVGLFHPSEKVLGWVKSCKEHAPMPIEQITDDMD